jgi:hypothetical protein
MRRGGQQDPETARLRRGPLPFPGVAIVGGEAAPVKTSLRRAKKRRGLDRSPLPAKTQIFLRRGNGSSVWSQAGVLSRCAQRGTKPYGFFPLWNPYSSLVIRGGPLDRGGRSHRRRGDAEETQRTAKNRGNAREPPLNPEADRASARL